MDIRKAFLVLADISGYTRFIAQNRMTLAHAELIITDLLESVIETAEYPLQLNKLEGDAALFYGWSDGSERQARDVAGQVLRFHGAFRDKLRHLADVTMCTCPACRNVVNLKLKVIAHHGEVGLKRVRQFEELAGPEVIRVHRLLKTSVGTDEYILLTGAMRRLCGALPGLHEEARTEQADGLGAMDVSVFYLQGAVPPPRRRPLPARMLHMLRLHASFMRHLLGWRRSPPLSRLEFP